MKKINKLILSACAVSLVLSSCSIEKRLHNDGYHVSWKHKSHTDSESKTESLAENSLKKTAEKVRLEEKQAIVAVVSEETPVVQAAEVKTAQENVATTEKSVASDHKSTFSAKNKELISAVQREKGTSFTKAAVKKLAKKSTVEKAADDELILLYILCVLLPVVAVGIVTDWSLGPVLLSILLMILFWLPAIIHAIIVVHNHR